MLYKFKLYQIKHKVVDNHKGIFEILYKFMIFSNRNSIKQLSFPKKEGYLKILKAYNFGHLQFRASKDFYHLYTLKTSGP